MNPFITNDSIMDRHIVKLFIMALLFIPISQAKNFQHSAEIFADNLSQNITNLLHVAGAIDPITKLELRQKRRVILDQQEKLQQWLRRKGGEIDISNCHSKIDKKNYLDFHNTMANRQFIRLPYFDRIQFIQSIEDYFIDLKAQIYDSLTLTLVEKEKFHTRLASQILDRIQLRLNHDIEFKIRYYNRDPDFEPGALYYPDHSRIDLNLNVLIESKGEFINSFEHELWHHLISPQFQGLESGNFWIEGFTECVSEIWGGFLRDKTSRRFHSSGTIYYPVQTAFASLFLGISRSLTISYLLAIIDQDEFLNRLVTSDFTKQVNENFPPKKSMEESLNENKKFIEILISILQNSKKMTENKQAKIERLLNDWGWREDDGSNLRINRFIKDGRFDNQLVTRSFFLEKQFITDIIRALTIVNLSNLFHKFPDQSIYKNLQLPTHLIEHIHKISRYVKEFN